MSQSSSCEGLAELQPAVDQRFEEGVIARIVDAARSRLLRADVLLPTDDVIRMTV